MVRHARAPWALDSFGIEPAIDRFISRAMDVPVWSGGADVTEADDRATIRVDVPGVRPEQLNVTVEHRTLSLKIDRDGKGSYTRQYTIGSKYDLNQVHAELAFGVLTLTLPKAAEAQSRSIPVQVS
jgi:HSP20 family molecular chaperone IbpA